MLDDAMQWYLLIVIAILFVWLLLLGLPWWRMTSANIVVLGHVCEDGCSICRRPDWNSTWYPIYFCFPDKEESGRMGRRWHVASSWKLPWDWQIDLKFCLVPGQVEEVQRFDSLHLKTAQHRSLPKRCDVTWLQVQAGLRSYDSWLFPSWQRLPTWYFR